MSQTLKFQMNHIVEAESEEEARAKLDAHYEKKTEAYDVGYWVNGINYIHEAIT